MSKTIIGVSNNIVDLKVHKVRKINAEYKKLRDDLNAKRLQKLQLEKRVSEYEIEIFKLKQKLRIIEEEVLKDLSNVNNSK